MEKRGKMRSHDGGDDDDDDSGGGEATFPAGRLLNRARLEFSGTSVA